MTDEENARIDTELQDRERAAEMLALADETLASLDLDRRLDDLTGWADQDIDMFANASCFAGVIREPRPRGHLRLVKGIRCDADAE